MRSFLVLLGVARLAVDWFYRFKLRLIVNERRGSLAIKLTLGNSDDRERG
jgi:hypothetical protein